MLVAEQGTDGPDTSAPGAAGHAAEDADSWEDPAAAAEQSSAGSYQSAREELPGTEDTGAPTPPKKRLKGEVQAPAAQQPLQEPEGGSAAAVLAPAPAAPSSLRLEECLARYVRRERLGPSELWVCERCQCRQEADKQLSLRQLPPVVCLHLKRFKHNIARGTVRVRAHLLCQSHLIPPASPERP